jgi:hypothetical protein
MPRGGKQTRIQVRVIHVASNRGNFPLSAIRLLEESSGLSALFERRLAASKHRPSI